MPIASFGTTTFVRSASIRLLKLSFTFPISLSLCPKAYGDLATRIVGGETVLDEKDFVFRHSARLLVSARIAAAPGVPSDAVGVTTSWRCSSSIVSDNALLTAAHCLPERGSFRGDLGTYWAPLVDHKIEVFYGRNSRVDDPIGAPATSYVRHPEYDDEWYENTNNQWEPADAVNDLAVIFLKDALPANKQPASLLGESEHLDGKNLVLAGYGRADLSKPLEIPELRKVQVPYIRQLLNGNDFFAGLGDARRPRRISNPRGGCSGDSGGGAFVQASPSAVAHLAGIIVRGPSQSSGGCETSVTILTDLRAYETWVKQALL